MTDDEPLRAYVREAMKATGVTKYGVSIHENAASSFWTMALTAARLASADRDKLIARNAELVEALEGLTKYEGHHVYCGHAPNYDKLCVCGFNDAHDNARKAIAKARGK